MKAERHKKPRPPLGPEGLERLALFYVGRYATTRARLRTYLARKIKERGWEGPGPDIEGLVGRLSELGYIDDTAFAAARSASLQRRGYGARRVSEALRAAGIEEEDLAEALDQAQDAATASALRFAQRKRIGPYAAAEMDREARQRAFAAMMRAGHAPEIAREVLNASPGDIPDSDKL